MAPIVDRTYVPMSPGETTDPVIVEAVRRLKMIDVYVAAANDQSAVVDLQFHKDVRSMMLHGKWAPPAR